MQPTLLIKGCPVGAVSWAGYRPGLPPQPLEAMAPRAETGIWDDPCARLITAWERKLLADSALLPTNI